MSRVMTRRILLRTTLACVAAALTPPARGQVKLRKDPAIYLPAEVHKGEKALPLSRSFPLTAPGVLRLTRLTDAEQKKLGDLGGKRRIGVHRDLAPEALAAGVWTTLPD